jgi:anaerobic selenocysteine-containing dehydrogenase
MADLEARAQTPVAVSAERPMLLIPRRENRVMNTYGRTVPGMLGNRTYNPAFINPEDLAELGYHPGDLVEISSEHDTIVGVVESDPDLRRGLVSMSHSFGRNPGEREDPRVDGANTNRLLRNDSAYDPVTGQPAMGAIAVSLGQVAAGIS